MNDTSTINNKFKRNCGIKKLFILINFKIYTTLYLHIIIIIIIILINLMKSGVSSP